MHTDPTFMPKTGKLTHIHDPRTLIFEDYTYSGKWQETQLPDTLNNGQKVTGGWPMYGNDRYGDCTCAAIGHMQQIYDAMVGGQNTPPEAEIISTYEKVTGFNPGPPPINDNGASMIDILNWWRKNPIAGQTIFAYSEIADQSDINSLKRCILTFGTAYIGLALPRTVMQQFQSNTPWDVVGGMPSENGPGTLGGHAIEYHGWDQQAFLGTSWGREVRITFAFNQLYSDEAWAPLSIEWKNNPPQGFSWEELEGNLLEINK